MKMPLLMIKVLSSLLVLHQLMKNQLEYNNNYNKKKEDKTDHCSLWFLIFVYLNGIFGFLNCYHSLVLS